MQKKDEDVNPKSEKFNPIKYLNIEFQEESECNVEFENTEEFRKYAHGQELKVERKVEGGCCASRKGKEMRSWQIPIKEETYEQVYGKGGVPFRPVSKANPTLERRFALQEEPLHGGPRKKRRNVLTRMEEIEGPLAILRQCRDTNTKVRVYTRNHSEIRGILTGYVVAFDKHWNIALRDVHEVFQKKIKCQTPAFGDVSKYVKIADLSIKSEEGELEALMPPVVPSVKPLHPMEYISSRLGPGESSDVSRARGARVGREETAFRKVYVEEGTAERGAEPCRRKRTRKRKKREVRERYVPQLLIRGENVVLIAVEEVPTMVDVLEPALEEPGPSGLQTVK